MEAGQKRSKNKREKCVERRQGLKVSERGGNRPACAPQKEKDPEEVVRRERRADLPTQAEEAAISFNPSERAHGLPSGGVIGKKGEHLSRLEVMPTKTPSRLNSRNITDGQMWISEGGRRRRIKYQRIPPPGWRLYDPPQNNGGGHGGEPNRTEQTAAKGEGEQARESAATWHDRPSDSSSGRGSGG